MPGLIFYEQVFVRNKLFFSGHAVWILQSFYWVNNSVAFIFYFLSFLSFCQPFLIPFLKIIINYWQALQKDHIKMQSLNCSQKLDYHQIELLFWYFSFITNYAPSCSKRWKVTMTLLKKYSLVAIVMTQFWK